jgi:cobyrinic acid a,c-diamide synthase
MGSPYKNPRGLVVAGTQSGAGKTTVTLALLAALRRRGLTVQAFKVGPDFIDPGHHAAITGRASHNLDGWMLSKEENLAMFNRYAAGADALVVEGVMGLYDGFDAVTEDGSTAQMAKWLNLPVLLCVNARSMARSAAALARGFQTFDPGLTWAGLVANQVGSPNHTAILKQALEHAGGLGFVGGLQRRDDIILGERHLGLVTAEQTAWDENAITRLADWLEEGVDLERLWDDLPVLDIGVPIEVETPTPKVRIGVARDAAFCFYYEENFRRLQEAGAELEFFSPLSDRELPPDLDGIYLGGGYPEVFARELTDNAGMREAVKAFGRNGGVVYAECGGFMYVSESLRDKDGRAFPMAGLLPVEVRMLDRLKSLGYREVTLTESTPLGPAGLTVRGHEFHYSEVIVDGHDSPSVYQVSGRRPGAADTKGYLSGSVLASYVHLHFGSQPDLACNLVTACLKFREGR